MTISNRPPIAAILLASLVSACGQEDPPPSVAEFMDDRILLEATIVRCGEDRLTSRYEPECVNAREAAELIGKAEEQARREALEAASARKREALRRARDAAEQRRRQQEEAERMRREAEEFGSFPPPEDGAEAPPEDDAEGMPPDALPAEPTLPPSEDGGTIAPAEADPAAGTVDDEPANEMPAHGATAEQSGA